MNELDRWVAVEGPPPEGVRELLDAAAPPLSPALEAALDARLRAAIADEDRRRAQRRTLTWRVALAAAAAIAAAAGGLAVFALRGAEEKMRPMAADVAGEPENAATPTRAATPRHDAGPAGSRARSP
jgi:anti-sigma-K factor RskA